ncbi:N-acetyltransferase [Euzebyella marina]|uniref:N-acetyltransferase n=1 Tax=Euzebyella marina TaxID=1761453 RepID=A0A3G2L9C4_9FLAO|nr:GNAT family N-acetyltransferase [Euzebyella marina]AYN68862.1 N-acetyltransferase [Euzebyella marina]
MNNLLLEGQETSRLLFRKVKESDFDEWLPFHQDERSSEFWNGIPSDPLEACKQQFDRIFERYEKELGGMNALILKENNLLIGLSGLLIQEVDGERELEVAYSILPRFWRQGFATEAALKCKAYAGQQQLAPSLISIIQVNNLPSQKVAYNMQMTISKTTVYKNNPVHIYRINL